MINQIQFPDKVTMEPGSGPSHHQFILQPLEVGYGSTIGNSLRRVLLSSIPSSAIVGVKITDVLHEFQSINGVKEDLAEIILNLKEVKIKTEIRKSFRIPMRFEGPGEIRAGDFQDFSPDIEIMNPDQYICILDDDTKFDMEILIERGFGYVPSEDHITRD